MSRAIQYPVMVVVVTLATLAHSAPGWAADATSQRGAPSVPGSKFKDCPECPEMMVIPKGSFTMGSPVSEEGRIAAEGPQHRVEISRAFAVGIRDVTFAEWDACVAAGGCGGYKPADQGWGRGTRPVINVSWQDALAYIEWLNHRVATPAPGTSGPYRLLSEAEWEYAARAGTTTAYFWGDGLGRGNANCIDCGSRWDNKQTSPSGSFAANAFGLYDMSGNVFQWTADCYHESYAGSPANGSSWTAAECKSQVLRGGAWVAKPESARSAYRDGGSSQMRASFIGFRLAESLF